MRINIEIDEKLLSAAQEATGLGTKKAVVEEGLRRLVKYKQQVGAFNALKGAADWQGSLGLQREDRSSGQPPDD